MQHFLPKSFKLLLLLCGILLLSGCTLRVAYHFLDWGLQWKLQHYFSLNSEQKTQAKSAINRLHEWHREHELPRYANYIVQLRHRLNQGNISADELHQQSDEVQNLLDDFIKQSMPDISQLMASLTAGQIQHFEKMLAKRRDDYFEQNVKPSAADQQRENYKDFKKQAESYIGSLTPEQRKWVEDWSQTLIPFGNLIIQEQKLWADKMLQVLTEDRNSAQLQNKLLPLLLYRTSSWQPEARKIALFNEHLSLQLIARILNNLSEKQRDTLNDKLNTYEQDCWLLTKNN